MKTSFQECTINLANAPGEGCSKFSLKLETFLILYLQPLENIVTHINNCLNCSAPFIIHFHVKPCSTCDYLFYTCLIAAYSNSEIARTVGITATANPTDEKTPLPDSTDQGSVGTFAGIAVGVFAVLLGIVGTVLVVGVVVRRRKISRSVPSPQELIQIENPSYGMVAIHSTTEMGVNPAYGASAGKSQ